MIKYPMSFEINASSTPGASTLFEAGAHHLPSIRCAIPPEFAGPGGGYSPEDLFALSALTCFIATFKVFAQKSGLAYNHIAGRTKLHIDRVQGRPEFTKLETVIELSGVGDEAKARQLLGEAEKWCLVTAAIRCEKSYNYQIT